MTQKNLYLIIAIALAVFLLIIGFFIFSSFIGNHSAKFLTTNSNSGQSASQIKKGDETQNPTPTSSMPVIKTSQATSSASSPFDFAKQNGDVNECLKAVTVQDKNMCVVLLAEYLQDKNLCSNIKEKNVFNSCVDRATYQFALKNKKISSCISVSDAQLEESCVLTVINELQNIKDNDCEVLPDKEKKYCLDYLGRHKDQLLSDSAQSPSDCQVISDLGIKTLCAAKFPSR
jgi:cytoskeletal protein RodZ